VQPPSVQDPSKRGRFPERVPEALILDFDGTLVDTETPALESVVRIWDAHGATLPMDWWLEGMGTDRKGSWIEELERVIGRPLDRVAVMEQRRMVKDEVTDLNPLLPGVVELLDEARRLGVALAVASSSAHDWVDRHLTRLGVFDRFDTICCRDDVGGVAKPSPDVYLLALERLGISAATSAAIEDSPHGMAAARAAGLRCGVVPNPLVRELDFTGAHVVLDDLAELAPAQLLALLAT
jgi:putative hydrolase of the HAD superfamily